MRQETAKPKMQQAFEDANPGLRLMDDSSVRVLGGLLIANPGSRWGYDHMPGSVWGGIQSGERWYSMGIDHTSTYYCSAKKRYVLLSQTYAMVPECQQHGECECLIRLMEHIDVVNVAHLKTKVGQRNRETLQVYSRDREYTWRPANSLLVIASSSVPINLDYSTSDLG